jgi:photosystem II stability/assembly factor-like uncharacterized protein
MTCMAVGANDQSNFAAIIQTSNGGRTWTRPPSPAVEVELDGISCSSRFSCTAVGILSTMVLASNCGVVLVTSNGGRTWASQTEPNGAAASAASMHYLIPPLPKRQTLPIGTDRLPTVSCASGSTCVAVGASTNGELTLYGVAIGSTNGGVTWTGQTVPAEVINLSAVSCTSETTCVAVGVSDGGVILASEATAP